jgi:hypothetical protein
MATSTSCSTRRSLAAAHNIRIRRRGRLAGFTPTLFEHVNPLGTYDFSIDRAAGQLRPLRAMTAA